CRTSTSRPRPWARRPRLLRGRGGRGARRKRVSKGGASLVSLGGTAGPGRTTDRILKSLAPSEKEGRGLRADPVACRGEGMQGRAPRDSRGASSFEGFVIRCVETAGCVIVPREARRYTA